MLFHIYGRMVDRIHSSQHSWPEQQSGLRIAGDLPGIFRSVESVGQAMILIIPSQRLIKRLATTDVDCRIRLAKMNGLEAVGIHFLGSCGTMSASADSLNQLKHSGYTLIRGVFAQREVRSVADRLSSALRECTDPSVLRSRGKIYGSRNLIAAFPGVREIPNHPILAEFITTVLGANAGMVRALFFDKPPNRSWSLPWHRDRTIAVKCNKIPTGLFRKPTIKAGIPHVEAPESLMAEMLTIRVHLDPMTAENGPLSVIPGSHLVEQQTANAPIALVADAGDVLAMRPLLLHASSVSQEGTSMHRRVIHLEFASCVELPDEYEWHSFCPMI